MHAISGVFKPQWAKITEFCSAAIVPMFWLNPQNLKNAQRQIPSRLVVYKEWSQHKSLWRWSIRRIKPECSSIVEFAHVHAIGLYANEKQMLGQWMHLIEALREGSKLAEDSPIVVCKGENMVCTLFPCPVFKIASHPFYYSSYVFVLITCKDIALHRWQVAARHQNLAHLCWLSWMKVARLSFHARKQNKRTANIRYLTIITLADSLLHRTQCQSYL